MTTVSRPRRAIDYPESDGKPMGETDVHRNWMVRIIEMVQRHFAGTRTYVSGDLLLYYVEGDPHKFIVPDAFVVKDCDPGLRRTYKLWEERRIPDFVLETTSRKTKQKDWVVKRELYARLGIPEYFLYDPLAEWLEPPLQGLRLLAGGSEYVEIAPDASGALACNSLGLKLRLEDGDLAMFDAAGRRLLTGSEEAEAARAEAEAAQRRIRELEAELARLRKGGAAEGGR